MKSLPNYITEKLVINKNFKDNDYELNNILQKTWEQIEDGNDKYTELDADSLIIEVADIAYDFGQLLSSIDGAIDATKSFRKCKCIYMLNSKNYITIIDALFQKLRKNNIELNQLEYDHSTGFSVEYKETNDFIILVLGDEAYYLTFIGNK